MQNEYLIRNREIQRRSRARRKDYIDDLERRVWQYQRDGVHATAEVQAAARKVADENYWLHSLLAKHGVSTAEIQEHLDSSRATSYGVGSDAAAMSGRGAQPSNHIEDQSWAQVAQSSQRIPGYTMPEERTDIELLSPTSTEGLPIADRVIFATFDPAQDDNSLPSRMRSEATDGQTTCERAQATTMKCQDCEQAPPSNSIDETSCEDAARIIAGMRGHEDPQRVWPELGCSTTKKTMVKNITIFQMADG